MGSSRQSMGLEVSVVMLLLALGGPAWAQALGEEGESCRARADCGEGLRCIENTCRAPDPSTCETEADCTDGQTCADGRCAEGAGADAAGAEATPAEGEQPEEGAAAQGGEESAAGGRWADFELRGTHFFAGVTFAPGMTGFWNYGGGIPIWASFFFSIRAGVLFGRTELSFELAPATWVWDFSPESHFAGFDVEGNAESVSFLINVGGLIRLADNVSWPLRFGLGLSARELPLTDVYMQGRLDLIGLVYQYGHLLFELDLPSIRFSSEFQSVGIWAWLFTISISYVV